MIPEFGLFKGLLAPALSCVAAFVVGIQQALHETPFTPLGGYIIAILLAVIGFLLAFGIRDFRREIMAIRKEHDEEMLRHEKRNEQQFDQLFSKVNAALQRIAELREEFARQCGYTQGKLEAADRILSRAIPESAEKKRLTTELGGAA